MNKQETGSGGGAAVAVVMILVVLGGFCVVVTLGGSLFYLGRTVQPVVITPAPLPVPVATKAAPAFRTAEIAVAADSSLKLDGKPVELNELQVQLQQIQAASPNMMLDVQVVPEEKAPYRAVSDVTDLLTATGFGYTVRPVGPAGAPAVAAGMGTATPTSVNEAAETNKTDVVQEATETAAEGSEAQKVEDVEKVEEVDEKP